MRGETAHRDVAKFKLPEDKIFGGWLNLDSQLGPINVAVFVCSPKGTSKAQKPYRFLLCFCFFRRAVLSHFCFLKGSLFFWGDFGMFGLTKN